MVGLRGLLLLLNLNKRKQGVRLSFFLYWLLPNAHNFHLRCHHLNFSRQTPSLNVPFVVVDRVPVLACDGDSDAGQCQGGRSKTSDDKSCNMRFHPVKTGQSWPPSRKLWISHNPQRRSAWTQSLVEVQTWTCWKFSLKEVCTFTDDNWLKVPTTRSSVT